MHNRSIRHNKFNLPSMRKLWKIMGGYDALVEYNECAVRQFINKWTEHEKEARQDFSDFIKEQSGAVGINLNSFNVDEYRQDILRWYLVHPYGCIDSFVKDFKEDLKTFGFEINLDFKDKNILEKLIEGMKEARISITVENYKLDLDKYYRRCRNILAHKLDESEAEKIKKLYENLRRKEILEFYPSLKNALSAPCELTFDDFTLCTANLKNITDTLTTDVFACIDWTKFKIDDPKFIAKLKKFSQKPERIEKAIDIYIRSNYGITTDNNILGILKEKLGLNE